MTGDVLPCFDFSNFLTPEDGACVVTVPTGLDMAANHGVILTSSVDGMTTPPGAFILNQENKLELVVDLLQKPTIGELVDSHAVRSEGTVLLDTGIFAVCGKAWSKLMELALEEPDPVSALLHSKKEVSLYEEIAGAWVPARYDWLKARPLGTKLIDAFSQQSLFSYCARDLYFLHFGTSTEVLGHLAKDYGGRVGRRHMVLAAGNLSSGLASSAVIVSSEINDLVFVGEESLVYDCTLNDGVQIGSHCIILGIHLSSSEAGTNIMGRRALSLMLPDWHCLWEVPLLGTEYRVTLCCGVNDNPKLTLDKMGTFCGKQWKVFLHEIGFEEKELWPDKGREGKDLWTAKLFPVLPPGEGIVFAMWLMGVFKQDSYNVLSTWRKSERVSLSELHNKIDFKRLCHESSGRQSRISLGLAEASLACGFLDRDLSKLCTQIVEGFNDGAEACKSLIAFCPDAEVVSSLKVPVSRVYQVRLDLCKASGDDVAASALENNVWDAVTRETASAVGQGEEAANMLAQPVFMFPISKAKVELPVRVDIVGGWSDTPPWSLEHAGAVLNMAVLLEGSAPIGAELKVTSGAGVSIIDDAGHHMHIDDPTVICAPFENEDPFRLVKSALLVTGLAGASTSWQGGLEIKTWANVPRGSGLGTSSILGAAVVKAILQIMGGNDSNENVTHLVLVLEQVMGTGGGWQDQIGGLYPGIKYTRSYPRCPLELKVEPVPVVTSLQRQLEERLLIFFTGQVRLAHQVLQNVVRRYLQRDAILISTIKELTHLAQMSHEALRVGNLDKLGKIMREVWLLHQELDPNCSNTFVDMIFKQVDHWACGYKLVGAGGGGFGVLMAKDSESAFYVKEVLTGLSVKVYNWSLCVSNF